MQNESYSKTPNRQIRFYSSTMRSDHIQSFSKITVASTKRTTQTITMNRNSKNLFNTKETMTIAGQLQLPRQPPEPA